MHVRTELRIKISAENATERETFIVCCALHALLIVTKQKPSIFDVVLVLRLLHHTHISHSSFHILNC